LLREKYFIFIILETNEALNFSKANSLVVKFPFKRTIFHSHSPFIHFLFHIFDIVNEIRAILLTSKAEKQLVRKECPNRLKRQWNQTRNALKFSAQLNI